MSDLRPRGAFGERSNAAVDFEISGGDVAALRDLRAQDYGEHSVFPVYSGK